MNREELWQQKMRLRAYNTYIAPILEENSARLSYILLKQKNLFNRPTDLPTFFLMVEMTGTKEFFTNGLSSCCGTIWKIFVIDA